MMKLKMKMLNCEFTLSIGDYSLGLRIPLWTKNYKIYKNDQDISDSVNIENGYAIIIC
ncbi:MAG: hypothetical protein PHT02_09620 [Tissierellia bacterium]|nr:hypothetical protein [Tissierellia bacterium]